MIKVFSRKEIEDLYKSSPENTTAIISINDISYPSPVPETHKNCLKLFFDDVTPYLVKHHLCFTYYEEAFKKREPVYFSDNMAEDTLGFIHGWLSDCMQCGTDLPLYIHCYAGVSRSSSVAMFAHMLYVKAFNKDTVIEGIDFDNCRMNPHVFAKLYKNEFFNKGDYNGL